MSKRNFILLIILLAILALATYAFLHVKTPPTNTGDGTTSTNFFSDFNPFKKKSTPNGTESTPADISGFQSNTPEEMQNMRFTKVSSMPIAGFIPFTKERFIDVPEPTTPAGTTQPTGVAPTAPPTEFVTALRYVAKATGNIYQTFTDKLNEQKFSDTVVPKVHEAYFGDRGESVIMRYVKYDNSTISTFSGTLPKDVLGADTSMRSIIGSFLPEGIQDMSVSPDTSMIFYLSNIEDTAVGITATPLGTNKNQIFNSAFTEWLSQWPNASMITLTTKPSATVPGYMYAINPNLKDFNKIIGGVNGLTTLTSPNGKLVLYSNNSLQMNVYNVETKTYRPLKIRTLPEKCVWGGGSDVIYCAVPKYPTGTLYPDSWYRGEVSFSDRIWKIDSSILTETMLLDPALLANTEDIDAIRPAVDENNNYLFFMNKKDNYLWELKIK